MRKVSEETRKRLSESHKGQVITEEQRRKISAAMKGKKRTPEHQAKLNAAQTGRPKSKETRAKISATLMGKPGHPHKEYARSQISKAQRARWERIRSEDSRSLFEYRAWQKAVFSRDHETCQRCGVRPNGRALHAHHRIPFDEAPDLRFSVENGLTLCSACHASIHSRGRKREVV